MLRHTEGHWGFSPVFLTKYLSVIATNHASEFLHTQNSVFSGICRHIQSYAALLRHIHTNIETLLRHTQAYSGIFSTLCNPLIFITL